MNDTFNLPQSSFPDLHLSDVRTSRGHNLPRWEANGAIYHVTFHLADSVPQEQLLRWREMRAEIQSALDDREHPPTESERQRLKTDLLELKSELIEKYLASGYGACVLKDPRAAAALEQTLLWENGRSYALHAYAIMPNHVHIIVGGFQGEGELTRITESWKRTSTHRINRILGLGGPLWRSDAYTHIIRRAEEYRDQLAYVWHNPDKAGLTAGFLRRRFV